MKNCIFVLFALPLLAQFGSPANLAGTTQSSIISSIAFDEFGNVFAVWPQQSATSGSTINIVASVYSGVTWSTPVVLISSNKNSYPNISAMSGYAIAVWAQATTANVQGIFSSSFSSGSWSSGASTVIDSVTTVSNAYSQPKVAINVTNSGVFGVAVWTYNTGVNTQIQASTYTSLEGWDNPTTISSTSTAINAFAPQIQIYKNNTAVATWSQTSGSSGYIQYSIYNPTTGLWTPSAAIPNQ